MNTNLNQLLKDLEIGPFVKILICLWVYFLCCTRPFHFTLFSGNFLYLYEQVLFYQAVPALYTGSEFFFPTISPVKLFSIPLGDAFPLRSNDKSFHLFYFF